MGICHLSTRVVLTAALVVASCCLLEAVVPSADASDGVRLVAPASQVGAADPVSTWHILLLIFRHTDTDYVDTAGVQRHLTTELPQSDIDALLRSLEPLKSAVKEWSGNQAAWDIEVQYPSQPVGHVSSAWGGVEQWLDPASISDALQRHFRPGYHDNVFVYWRNRDGAGGQIPDGGAWGLASLRRPYGYVTVTYLGWTVWKPWAVDGDAGVWTHEWLHNVCSYYAGLGYRMPVGDADAGGRLGYYPDKPPYPGWGAWYADLMNNRVLEDGVYTGIPSEAWARATIRDSVDEVAPVTIQSGADSAWHNSPVTVSLTATDQGSPPSGVWETSYQVDDGPWTIGTECTVPAPADHSGDGLHSVGYRSTDRVGNTGASGVTVKMDTLGPVTSARAAGGHKGRPITLRYIVTDAQSPQASAIRLSVTNSRGGVVKTSLQGTKRTAIWYRLTWTPKAKGSYRYDVYANDLAGNPQSVLGSAKITVK